jgi:hypothetical protein
MCVFAIYKKQFNTVQEALQSGKLKPGCALAFPRGIYWHYAIYLGQFKVDATGVKKAVIIHRAQQEECKIFSTHEFTDYRLGIFDVKVLDIQTV